MNAIIRKLPLALLAASAALILSCASTANRTESEFLNDLNSPSENTVCDALRGLERNYPNSPAARAGMIARLDDSREIVRRRAARALGAIGARVDDQAHGKVVALLSSRDDDAIIDGLKALRGMGNATAVSAVVPLLKSNGPFVKRDACRTLSVLADKTVIADIEPLLNDKDSNVQADARLAIAKLQEK